jgi:hypothetical protein
MRLWSEKLKFNPPFGHPPNLNPEFDGRSSETRQANISAEQARLNKSGLIGSATQEAKEFAA